jgi:hypothetical protein
VPTTPPPLDIDRILRGLSLTADKLEDQGHDSAALSVRTAVREVRELLEPCADCNGRGYTEDAICVCSAGSRYRDALDAQHERTMQSVYDAHGRAS